MFSAHEKLLSDNSIELSNLEENESKALTTVSNGHVFASSPPKLNFLYAFTEQEIQDLEKSYERTRWQLDAVIPEYCGVFWAERIQNWLACATGGLIIVFVINTSNEAFVNLVQLIPEATIPNALSNSISVPIAIISTGLFAVTFSCQKEAVKTVLSYAYRKPLKIMLLEEWQRAQNYPARVALDSAKLLTNHSIMVITNLTGALPLIINITDELLAIAAPFNWMIIGSILYFGERFFDKYLRMSYFDGLTFFSKLLRGEKKHYEIAGTVEAILQAVSSTVLRVYPYYYWLALAANQALGWWPPAPLVAVAAAVNSLVLFYPSAYKYFFADQEQVEKLLAEKFQHLPDSERNDAIMAEKNRLMQLILEQQGKFFLFKKNKIVIPVFAYDVFIGGYIGYELGLMCAIDPIAFPIISSVFFGSLFGGFLYQAEATRLSKKLCREILEEKTELPEEKVSVNEKLATVAGNAINLSTAASIVTSIISTGTNLAKDSPLLRSIIFLGAGKRGLNIIQFNRDRILNTVKGLVPPGNIFKSTWACFFKESSQTTTVVEAGTPSLRPRSRSG